jgi:hypothetical protein
LPKFIVRQLHPSRRLSGRLLDLADQVRRDKTELAGQIAALARDAQSRLG